MRCLTSRSITVLILAFATTASLTGCQTAQTFDNAKFETKVELSANLNLNLGDNTYLNGKNP